MFATAAGDGDTDNDSSKLTVAPTDANRYQLMERLLRQLTSDLRAVFPGFTADTGAIPPVESHAYEAVKWLCKDMKALMIKRCASATGVDSTRKKVEALLAKASDDADVIHIFSRPRPASLYAAYMANAAKAAKAAADAVVANTATASASASASKSGTTDAKDQKKQAEVGQKRPREHEVTQPTAPKRTQEPKADGAPFEIKNIEIASVRNGFETRKFKVYTKIPRRIDGSLAERTAARRWWKTFLGSGNNNRRALWKNGGITTMYAADAFGVKKSRIHGRQKDAPGRTNFTFLCPNIEAVELLDVDTDVNTNQDFSVAYRALDGDSDDDGDDDDD